MIALRSVKSLGYHISILAEQGWSMMLPKASFPSRVCIYAKDTWMNDLLGWMRIHQSKTNLPTRGVAMKKNIVYPNR